MNTTKPRTATHGAPSLYTQASPPPPPPVAPDLADLRLLAMREVRGLVGLSESRIRELIAARRFPAPTYRDGSRCTRWAAGAIRQWLQDAQKAAT